MPAGAVGDDGKLEIVGIVVEVEARPRIEVFDDDARFALAIAFGWSRSRRMTLR